MSTKWLGMALGRQKEESPKGKAGSTGAAGNGSPSEAASADKFHANGDRPAPPKSQADLQSTEDIYRAAGIMTPRMGYSISKVVEMLNSDHVRALSKDAKRAAVLMALDAANISIGEVLRDAQLRQDVLDAYQGDQLKRFEEYWARKAGTNAQIQEETDRLTAQSFERIKRNLDEVAHEKAEFARWQTMKHQEAERISEAVGLFSKPSDPEPPCDLDAVLNAASTAETRLSQSSTRDGNRRAEYSEILAEVPGRLIRGLPV